MKTVGIIRGRGQLTIPGSIRKKVKWAGPMSAVSINVVKPDKIVIQPQQTNVDWEEIWAAIKQARAITGGAKAVSAADFLQKDRASH